MIELGFFDLDKTTQDERGRIYDGLGEVLNAWRRDFARTILTARGYPRFNEAITDHPVLTPTAVQAALENGAVMRISITGATGDIGGSYLNHAIKSNELRVLIRDGSKLPDSRNVQQFTYKDSFKFDVDLLEDFTDSNAVVHFAALLNLGKYKLEDILAINAFLTAALVIVSRKKESTPQFVLISSEMVYALEASEKLMKLADQFKSFCLYRMEDADHFDLKALAGEFIAKTKEEFPYDDYNHYALAKFLGEEITKLLKVGVVLRVSSVYGPEYTNPRLIPRMIKGRLTGHDTTYPNEVRDFVYSEDINNLISSVLAKKLSGIIDCKSNEAISTTKLAGIIIDTTPTAYGKLIAADKVSNQEKTSVPAAEYSLEDIVGKVTPFEEGLAKTIRRHKERGYHQMQDSRSIEDFLEPGESVVKKLRGSSAAHLYITVKENGQRVVRKIAIYDGVEGNGIAKVANEMRYYRYLTYDEPRLATMYAKLLDSQLEDTFSSITIEYLDGKNFYEALKSEELPYAAYKKSYEDFIARLCVNVLPKSTISMNPESNLDVFYIERSATRLHAIKEVLDIQDKITINGKECLSPHVILEDMTHNKALRNYVLPQFESICFHGDMTLLNNVFLNENREIKMIDPRGFIGSWDPLYDFAKLHFTLSGFGELVVGEKPMITGMGNNYRIHFENLPANAVRLRNESLDIFGSNETFKKYVIKREPYWRHRINLAEATHFLADIPFRLYTDESPRNAISSYILGTYYLNQAYEALKNENSRRTQ